MESDPLNYALIGLTALVFLVVAWFVFRTANRKTTVIDRSTGDVLDEGAAPAARNQALIDAHAPAVPDPIPAPAPNPELAAEPAPPPAPTPVSAPASGDDLTRIKGLGPKIVAILAEQGVTTFAQIAAWSDADVARVDATLGRFAGRITRDQWVEQAKLLAAGDEAAFAGKFGQNG